MKNTLFICFSILFGLFCVHPAFGDERIDSRIHLMSQGFAAISYEPTHIGPTKFTEAFNFDFFGILEWPVKFEDESHTIGQNFLQYQDYGDRPYIHGGCDLRALGDSDVRAPISGILEGGFYGYATNENGSLEKYWKPWDGTPKRDPYFELAVVSNDGTRYELHHIDSEKLPQATIDALNNRGSRVVAGAILGKVNGWAFDYQKYPHVHYNIIRNDGVRINPEALSSPLSKNSSPEIERVYVPTNNGQLKSFQDGDFVEIGTEYIVLVANDRYDKNVYVNPPVRAEIYYQNGDVSGYNFSQFLLDPKNLFPDIRNVFIKSIVTPDQGEITTRGNWGRGPFVMKIPIISNHKGSFAIVVSDSFGREVRKNGIFK